MCASDKKTYPNKCAMDVAACESQQYLRVVKPGECGKFMRLRLDISLIIIYYNK